MTTYKFYNLHKIRKLVKCFAWSFYNMLYAFFIVDFQMIEIIFENFFKNICIYKIYIVYLQYQI